MTMMDVGVVRMRVRHRIVPVRMRVRFLAVPFELVHMAMMGIVRVLVRVTRRLVRVRMRVALGDVQPHSGKHQDRGDPEQRARRFGKQQQGYGRAEKRCYRKVRSRARRSQAA